MRFFLFSILLITAAVTGPFVWQWAKPELAKLLREEVQAAEGDPARPEEEEAPPIGGQLELPDNNEPPDDVEPPAKNALIESVRQMMKDNPAFDEIRGQGIDLDSDLRAADEALARIKEENRQAMQRLRSPPLRARGGGRRMRRPHVVLVDLGRLRVEDMSCYRTIAKEPREDPKEKVTIFDALARQGVMFEAFYRTSVNDDASCWALVTGRFQRGPPLPTVHASVTLGGSLQRLGYRSAMIGDGSFAPSELTPSQFGFDSFFGAREAKTARQQYPRQLWSNNARVDVVQQEGEKLDAQEIYLREAESFVDRQTSAKPSFLWLSLPLPNSTWEGDYRDHLRRAERDLIRLVTRLNVTGAARNSIVIVTNLRQGDAHAPAGLDPLKRRKQELDEGNLQAPLLIVGPGRVRRNAVTDRLCSVAGLAATILELADSFPTVAGWEGESFAPLLLGRRQAEADPIVWKNDRGDRAVRSQHWKALRRAAADRTELYDLRADPGEQRDVSGYYPAEVARMKQKMRDALR